MPYVSSHKPARASALESALPENSKLNTPVPLTEEVLEWEQKAFDELISVDLSEPQIESIVTPAEVYPQQEEVVALHWHPEFVPIDLIEQRVQNMFPNKKKELIVPTDHNILKSYDGCYTGVEVDCFSREFNRKVQLLLHLENSRLEHADTLKSMLTHTLKYRSSQLFELLDSIIEPRYDERLQEAADQLGTEDELIHFVQSCARKVQKLFFADPDRIPVYHVKNKLLANFVEKLQDRYDERLIHRALSFIQKVKKIVKRNFSPEYFHQTEEIIEEARALGAGIIIPHPEQFWPILLAEYDVDGYEVWNPQSRNYTEFLINVVNRHNRHRRNKDRPLLIFMGDDTHMAEKVKAPHLQNTEKARRQVGYQKAWDDLAIRKSLSLANWNRSRLIQEYKERLGSPGPTPN